MTDPFKEFIAEDPARKDIFIDLIVEILTNRTPEEQRLKDYNNGLKDTELAELWGITKSAVQYWRDNRKLESNGRSHNN